MRYFIFPGSNVKGIAISKLKGPQNAEIGAKVPPKPVGAILVLIKDESLPKTWPLVTREDRMSILYESSAVPRGGRAGGGLRVHTRQSSQWRMNEPRFVTVYD